MTSDSASLVLGADGIIGRSLADRLILAGENVVETTRRPDTVAENRIFLDLREDVSGWHPPRPITVAYLCAAVTSMDYCRKDPAGSARVNVLNTVALAKSLLAQGVLVIFPSTNLVYDGSIPYRQEDDPVCPQTEYGRQKAEAERQLLAVDERVAVVRFTKILDRHNPLFQEWLQALRKDEIIHPFADVVMSPVPLSLAVNVLHMIALLGLNGIMHVSGDRDITYEHAIRHIARRRGVGQHLVQPIRMRAAGLHFEAQPIHTTLNMTRNIMQLGIEPPDVWSTLDALFC